MQRRFEILSYEPGGGLPALVRSQDGSVLRLSHAPTGTLLGSFSGRAVYGSVLNVWEEERTAGMVRPPGSASGWLELDDAAPGGAWSEQDPVGSGWLDEVGVRIGPERGGGLFERTVTDADASVETTATAGRVLRPEFSRMAVLARVAAWQDPYEGAPVPAEAVREDALEALRRVIVSEPLDPLPVLGDVVRVRAVEPEREPVALRAQKGRAFASRAWMACVIVLVGLAASLVRC